MLFVGIIMLSMHSCNIDTCTGFDNFYQLTLEHEDDFGRYSTNISCDSFKMINENSAIIWNDGTPMKVISNNGIRASDNPCYLNK